MSRWGRGQVGATGVRGGDLRAGQAIFLYPLGALHRVSGTMGYRKKKLTCAQCTHAKGEHRAPLLW